MTKRLFLFFTLIASCTSFLHAQESDKPAPKPVVLDISGGIYLFEYIPTNDVVSHKFEIYAFVLRWDAYTPDKRFGLHVENRLRDTKLRSFFNSNIWFQEAFAYARLSFASVNIGKVYRKVGMFWDDTFFGNVHYFNGLKLNPDFGVELVRNTAESRDRVVMNFSLQFFTNSDKVDGALPGRDVESDTLARLTNAVTARVEPRFNLANDVSLAVGVSGLYGKIDRTVPQDFYLKQVAGDATLWAGPVTVFGEVLRQEGELNDAKHPLSRPGYDNATYILAGFHWKIVPRLTVRTSVSQATYDGANATERELLPGVVFSVIPNLNVLAEYDYWEIKPSGGPVVIIDRSVNLVVNFNF